ncbi:amyloid beta precursor like protein 1 isoform X2 [Bombina bombina]|uniref:amyloid beta precursor like protein 1 isoform X2 n=1 Tax=Bombina bombina TaxID=8345 RepID=UPI00235B1440|nr:amyloid beta precursor like protein 1 isoform X2 [Bombina bombina]
MVQPTLLCVSCLLLISVQCISAWRPQLALFCGRVPLHMDLMSGDWVPDPRGICSCLGSKEEILQYCRQVYPELQITGVAEAATTVTVTNWCPKQRLECKGHQHIVVPYHCLGEFVSDALLVPDKCRFLHREQMDVCESYQHWHETARGACAAEDLDLHSYGMLLPCHPDHFRGVEYVCCPTRHPPRPEPTKGQPYTETEPQDTEKGDDGEADEDIAEVIEEDGEDTVGADADQNSHVPWDDYFVGQRYEEETTSAAPTHPPEVKVSRPTDGVDIYFESPREGSEHANFLRAIMELEERRMKQINEVMKEWAEADNQAKNLPKSDRQALNEHFQSILQTLEGQISAQRQRLVETHLGRVVAALNDNRRSALENYLASVQATPLEPERVLLALKRYIRAEQKDQRHTVRHYQHVSRAEPDRAETIQFQVLTHLRVIEERVNQSLSLLYRNPQLSPELRDQIETWLHTEWVEARDLLSTTQKKMNEDSDYTEIRVPPQNSAETSQGEGEDSQQIERKGSAVWDVYSDFPPSEQALSFPAQKDNASMKQVHYQAEDMQKDEMEPDTLVTFNRGALIGLLVVAIAVAMVIIISLLLIRRKPYGTISHGIIEVEASRCPEDKHLSKMQNQGYENPTYRYLEENN